MKPRQFVTQGIVLARTDFGEADRIITFLTPDSGKVKAMAKGVRKIKSKLAGGIELFSVSDLTFIAGKREIDTLISSRLLKHYGSIVKHLDRTTASYDIIKLVNKATEDVPEIGYFNLLNQAFEGLDDLELDAQTVRLWFEMQLLKLTGHAPDLQNDISGSRLKISKNYNFHFEEMKFGTGSGKGSFSVEHIKFLRVGFAAAGPKVLSRVEGGEKISPTLQPLIQSMLKPYIRL